MRSARIYDPVLRILHWVNAALISLLLASGLTAMFTEAGHYSAWLHDWHGVLGTTLLVSLAARVSWGLTGSRHARITDLWHPESWLLMWRSRKFFTAPARFGHHPTASLAYLALYVLLAMLALSGLVLLATQQGTGPLSHWLAWHVSINHFPNTLHTVAAWLVLVFVCLHFAALVLHPLRHKLPVAQAMISGIQYLPEENR